MNMELRTLRVFIEVVREDGFTAAARSLNSTQSTVSKSVKQLEDEIGVPLLDRIGHRIELTAAGRIVHRRALAILAERDDLVTEIDELRGMARGSLRIGLPPLGSSTLFAPLFAIYRSRWPGIEISLVEHGSKRLEEMVLAGELDLAASLLPVVEELEVRPVRDERLKVLLPKGHPLAGRKRLGLRDLADSPLILFETGFALNQIILSACDRLRIRPTIAARSGQIDFIIELVAAGLGVAFLPQLMADRKPHAEVRQVLLDEPGTEWRMALVWRRGGYLAHAARAWVTLTEEVHGPQKLSRPSP